MFKHSHTLTYIYICIYVFVYRLSTYMYFAWFWARTNYMNIVLLHFCIYFHQYWRYASCYVLAFLSLTLCVSVIAWKYLLTHPFIYTHIWSKRQNSTNYKLGENVWKEILWHSENRHRHEFKDRQFYYPWKKPKVI